MAGIVVESLTTGMRYARSEENFNPKEHKFIRNLTSQESVNSYMPKAHESEQSTLFDQEDEDGTEEVESSN